MVIYLTSYDAPKSDPNRVNSLSERVYMMWGDAGKQRELERFLAEPHNVRVFSRRPSQFGFSDDPNEELGLKLMDRLSLDDKVQIANEEVTKDEITEFMKFVHLYGRVSHWHHTRKSGGQYDSHPIEAMLNLAKQDVSYKSLAAMRLHDVVEERVKNEIKSKDPNKEMKTAAIYYSIGLEIYNFVKNNDKITNKGHFYESINIIMRIVANLSHIGEKTYFRYLQEQIVYDDPESSKKNTVWAMDPKSIENFLGIFNGVDKNSALVDGYIRDVHNLRFSDEKKHEDAIKRRTLMCKLSDITVNINDMKPRYETRSKGMPSYFRLWSIFKGLVISEAVGDHIRRLGSQGVYEPRIRRMYEEFRALSLEELSKDIAHLNRTFSPRLRRYMSFVDHCLNHYDESNLWVLTKANPKFRIRNTYSNYKRIIKAKKRGEKSNLYVGDLIYGNPIDGTLFTFVRMMVEGKKELKRYKKKDIYLAAVVLHKLIETIDYNFSIMDRSTQIEGLQLDTLAGNYEELKKVMMSSHDSYSKFWKRLIKSLRMPSRS